MRWVNFHISSFKIAHSDKPQTTSSKNCGDASIDNFSDAFVDGTNHWIILKQLKLIDSSTSLFGSDKFNSNHFNTDRLIETINGEKWELNDGKYVFKRDIVQANSTQTFIYLLQLMVKYSNIKCESKELKQIFETLDNGIGTCDQVLKQTKDKMKETAEYSEIIAHRYYRHYKETLHKQKKANMIERAMNNDDLNVGTSSATKFAQIATNKQKSHAIVYRGGKRNTQNNKNQQDDHELPAYFKTEKMKIRTIYEEVFENISTNKQIVFDQCQLASKQYKIFNLLHNEFNVILQDCLLYGMKLLSLHRRGILSIVNDRIGLQSAEYYSKIDQTTFLKDYIPSNQSADDAESKIEILRKCERVASTKINEIKAIFQTYAKRDTTDPVVTVEKIELSLL